MDHSFVMILKIKGRVPLREKGGRQMTLLYCFQTAFHETLRVQVTGESFCSLVKISKENEHTAASNKTSFLSLGFTKNSFFLFYFFYICAAC